MNIIFILLVSAAIFFIAYRFYASFIEKTFEIDGTHRTPAVEVNDGKDYVPTKRFVIFGHHFASIAGGGPIIGPTVALIFGYIPVWLWIIIGTVFIGAVHDFTALLTSIREKGHSVAEIAKRTMGRNGFLLFIGFTIIMLLMLTSVFLNLTTTALSSKYPLEYFGNNSPGIQTVTENGKEYAVIGGIASTSVIIITGFAPLLGYLLYRKKINIVIASVIAIAVCLISIEIGLSYPLRINSFVWMIIISVYALVAAGVPVWMVLQPRDFTNSFLLYGGVAALITGSIVAGIAGGDIYFPGTNIAQGNLHLGYIWPILFITVACGAVSGFHALVAGGTTSKQISSEKPDAKTVAFGGMILESMLAIGVMIAVCYGIPFVEYSELVFPSDPGVKSNPILAFSLGMAGLLEGAFGLNKIYGTIFGILMVEGFVLTTLDTAVRLNRYLLEELWQMIFKKVPKILNTYIFNSFLCVALMFLLAYYNAFKQLWQLFGSANQLLAAITLFTVSLWLLKKGKRYIFTLIPGIFMLVTTIAALLTVLIKDYIPKGNIVLSIGDVILLALAFGVLIISGRVIINKYKSTV